MTKASIENAQGLAEQFISASVTFLTRLSEDETVIFGCKESGALRRASLDLTRALAEMRKP